MSAPSSDVSKPRVIPIAAVGRLRHDVHDATAERVRFQMYLVCFLGHVLAAQCAAVES